MSRRLVAWLWSVNPDALSPNGWALTLTTGHTPATADEWHDARKAFLKRLDRAGVSGLQWLTEWTAKGRPHLHLSAFMTPGDLADLDKIALVAWLEICDKRGWPASTRAQHIVPISGATGWLEYVSKHSARGVAHYQRQGAPEGWEKTGKLWGVWGQWPVELPVESDIRDDHFYRYRRLSSQWQRDRMRRAARKLPCTCPGDKTAAGAAPPGRTTSAQFRGSHDAGLFRAGVQACHRHRMLRAAKMIGYRFRDREKGKVMGVSGWIPDSVSYTLLLLATDGNLTSGLYEMDDHHGS